MPNQPMHNGAFSGPHPEQLMVLNNSNLVGVFAGRTLDTGNTTQAGVLLGGNVSNAWIDRSGYNDGDPNNYLPQWAYDITVDPRDPTQQTWYAGMNQYGYYGSKLPSQDYQWRPDLDRTDEAALH